MRPQRWRIRALALLLWLPIGLCQAQAPLIDHVELFPQGPHHIGDRLELRIEITTPAEQPPRVAVPSGDTNEFTWGTPIAEAIGSPASDGAQRWLVRCPVQPFIVGDAAIPSLDVGVGQQVLRTATIALRIDSVRSGSDADVLRDILPPVSITESGWWIPTVGAALAFLCAAVLFVIYRMRTRSRGPVEQTRTEAAQTPEQWLDEQFDLLMKQTVRDAEGLRAFVARVADVVREYLALKAAIPAPQRTTHHTLAVARGVLSDETTAQLEQLLTAADRAKFAREVPAAEAARAHLDRARGLCRQLALSL